MKQSIIRYIDKSFGNGKQKVHLDFENKGMTDSEFDYLLAKKEELSSKQKVIELNVGTSLDI